MYKQLERYGNIRGRIRVAKYARCSSDEQKKNGYTIGDQLDLLEDFCAENELIGAGEYVDEGVSATLEISKRKALAQLIEDAKAGKFDIVVFKCIDRFFRNVGEYYECQKQLRKAGVTWISIEESDLDPEDDDAAFKINIYLTMAEYEAKKTSKRIHFNNKMRIKNKQVITGSHNFPFPWKVVGEPRQRYLEKDMETAEMLYDLLDYYEKHQGKRAAVQWFNAKYAKRMSVPTFTNLISNTLLYGEYKGVADYVEPYITKERFDKLQDLQARNARHSAKTERVFLFSGLIKCRCCGRVLIGNFTRPNQKYDVYLYRCNLYRLEKVCENHHAISERKIEKQLLQNLEQYISSEFLKIETISEKKKPSADHTLKIEEIKSEMDRLNIMFRKRRIDEATYDSEFYMLEKELAKIENIEKPSETNVEALKELLESDWKTLYSELNRENKKAFWRNLIKEFSIDEERKIVPESIIFF